MLDVLDLFSAAAGGWSLGMHRAGFRTVAACEAVEWRRALYAENNPHVRLYDDVRTLTATRVVADLGYFPGVLVGSPPCQDISSANTKGLGVDGERSGLFFEAIRLVGEGRPRWVALENSANLRTRGADRVLGALEDLGYACWPLVVRGSDVGANHERPRCWIIGCDPDQLADAHLQPMGRSKQPQPESEGGGVSSIGAASGDRRRAHGAGSLSWRHGGMGLPSDADQAERRADADPGGDAHRQAGERPQGSDRCGEPATPRRDTRNTPDAYQARQAHGCVVAGLRPAEIAEDGCGDERGAHVAHAHSEGRPDGSGVGEMGGRAGSGVAAVEPWADWNGGLAGHLRVDDGLSAWVAQQRVAVGGPRGTSAAALIVEAFGDAVVPQITEIIGRAILRTEASLAAVYEDGGCAGRAGYRIIGHA